VHIAVPSRATLVDLYAPLRDPLEAAGIRVTANMRLIDPPCVFLPIPEISYKYIKPGQYSADVRPVIITRLTDQRLAIDELSALLEAVQTAWVDSPQNARPVEVQLADTSSVVLALELSFHVVVRIAQ
jgi:hypothetical protein